MESTVGATDTAIGSLKKHYRYWQLIKHKITRASYRHTQKKRCRFFRYDNKGVCHVVGSVLEGLQCRARSTGAQSTLKQIAELAAHTQCKNLLTLDAHESSVSLLLKHNIQHARKQSSVLNSASHRRNRKIVSNPYIAAYNT